MSKFEIESGIEVPPAKRGPYAGGNTMSGIIRSLDIGQSVFFHSEKKNSVASVVSKIKKNTGLQFVTRLMVKDGKKGVRVWRVSENLEAAE